jgi:isoamylase
MTADDWTDPNALSIALYLDGSDDPDEAADGTRLVDDDFLVLVNAWWEPLEFTLPATREQAAWQAEIDTYDLAAPAGSTAVARRAGDRLTAGPRSVVVLKSPCPPQ